MSSYFRSDPSGWAIFAENLLLSVAVMLLVASIVGFRGWRNYYSSTRGRRTLIGVMLLLAAVAAWPISIFAYSSVPHRSDPGYLLACQHFHNQLRLWRSVGIILCFLGLSIAAFGDVTKRLLVSMAAVGLGFLWLIGTAPIPPNCVVTR